MKDQFVTYEIAKKLKELGFNEMCLGRYTLSQDLQYPQSWKNSQVMGASAPLWQQAIDWLLKEYSIELAPDIKADEFDWVYRKGGGKVVRIPAIGDRDKSKEAAVLKALELITK